MENVSDMVNAWGECAAMPAGSGLEVCATLGCGESQEMQEREVGAGRPHCPKPSTHP